MKVFHRVEVERARLTWMIVVVTPRINSDGVAGVARKRDKRWILRDRNSQTLGKEDNEVLVAHFPVV